MTQLDVRIVPRHTHHDLAPQAGSLKHVGLFHRADLLAALARGVERHARDARDLVLGVHHGVESLALTVGERTHTARLAEVNIAGEFAHDQEIESGHDLGLERRGRGKLRVENRRAQVGEQLQLRTQPEQRLFRPQLARQRVVFQPADGAQQHRIGRLGELQRRRRQRLAGLVVGRAAHGRGFELDFKTVIPAQALEHLHCLGHHLGTDAVARQHSNFFAHRRPFS